MGEIAFSIAWFICTAIILLLYHSVFSVYYFSPQGCLSELVICGFLGGVLAIFGLAFIKEHWFIILGIIVAIMIMK